MGSRAAARTSTASFELTNIYGYYRHINTIIDGGTWTLRPDNHYFCGFDQSGDRVAFSQAHFPHRVGCDDGGDVLFADRKSDLRKQPTHLQRDYAAYELVAATDAAKCRAALGNVSSPEDARKESVDL